MTAPYYQDELATLYLGDSREVLEWLAADILIMDPPYGIGWTKGTNKAAGSWAHTGIQNDSDTTLRDTLLSIWGDKPAAVFGSWRAEFPDARQTLVWQKPVDAGVVGSTTGFRLDTELIFLTGKWPTLPPARSSVLTTGSNKNAYLSGHPHAKPVQVMQTLIVDTSGVVADPTAGGGTTLVAAASLGRQSVGVEIDERYCEIAALRLSQQAFDFGSIA